jgi:hypothetical protein
MKRIAAAVLLLIGLWCPPQVQANFEMLQLSSANPSCPDTTPPMATALGFTTCTFFDSMTSLSTVDTLGSGTTGFNWYTQDWICFLTFTGHIDNGSGGTGTTLTVTSVNYQENCNSGSAAILGVGMTIGSGGGTNATAGTQITALGSGSGTTGTYTVNNSQNTGSINMTASYAQAASTMTVNSSTGLQLSNVSQGDNNLSISTFHILTDTTGTTSTYHGTSFKNGMYYRAYLAFDETKGNSCTHELAQCRWPAEWWLAFQNGGGSSQFTEFDLCDCEPGSSSVALFSFLHSFNTTSGELSSSFNNATRAEMCNPVWNGTTYHTIDGIWVPATSSTFASAGIYAVLWDAATCNNGAFFQGSSSGTSLTVSSVQAGTIAVNQFITCNGCPQNLQISSGSGTSWTMNLSVSLGAATQFIATNGNNCVYYGSGSGSRTPCAGVSPPAGVYAEQDANNGFPLVFSSGCTASIINTPAGAECSGATGSWPMFIKNVQVWQTSLANKVVQ